MCDQGCVTGGSVTRVRGCGQGLCDQGGGCTRPLDKKRLVCILLECFLVVVILTEALNLKISYF